MGKGSTARPTLQRQRPLHSWQWRCLASTQSRAGLISNFLPLSSAFLWCRGGPGSCSGAFSLHIRLPACLQAAAAVPPRHPRIPGSQQRPDSCHVAAIQPHWQGHACRSGGSAQVGERQASMPAMAMPPQLACNTPCAVLVPAALSAGFWFPWPAASGVWCPSLACANGLWCC